MTEEQKEILQAQLNREKKTIAELKLLYAQAAKDIEANIQALSARTDMENLQTIIYQRQYQEALKAQVNNILEMLHANEFATIQDYLTHCYTDGYVGVMYDLMAQGIPIIMPINQDSVVKALQTDSKISTTLYRRLGEDVNGLKTSIRSELSRGISQGQTWNQIASHIAKGMNSSYNTAYNNAIRIARTEGHRIQCQSAYDAQKVAQSKGADVVKQWDSTLDNRTRKHHRMLDGQIREVDEPFEVEGMKAMYPSGFGRASEDVNCRCALLQRARWALDEDELKTLQERAEFFGLDKTEDFDDFRNRYLQASNGLSADENRIGFIPEHQEPDFIGHVDYNDRDAVDSVIKSFEEDAIKENIETACVITRSGEIYKCYGIGDAVFPDYDLGDKIIGATISHNHPIEYTQYSFGKSDFLLFEEYNLDCLRGVDIKYTYEFNRNSDYVDEHMGLFEMTDEDYAHEESIGRAERAKIGYTRWRND